MSKEKPDYARLIELIRRIAIEEAWQAIDEHLSDYEHKEKPAEDACL
jgi:hypothetical protein